MTDSVPASTSVPVSTSRRRIGERLGPLVLTTLAHGELCVPAEGYVHLQFRRFAGCPICNLHLRTFAASHDRLVRAGVQTVAFFHSPAELMRPYQGDLPFPTVPDPTRRWYRELGVERSVRAVAHPRAMWAALRGVASAPFDPFAGGTDPLGLPADFLVDPRGLLVAGRYGAHADDQWSIEQLLDELQNARSGDANPPPPPA